MFLMLIKAHIHCILLPINFPASTTIVLVSPLNNGISPEHHDISDKTTSKNSAAEVVK